MPKKAGPPEANSETLEFPGNFKIPFLGGGISSVFPSVLHTYSSYEAHSHSNIQTFQIPRWQSICVYPRATTLCISASLSFTENIDGFILFIDCNALYLYLI